MAAPVLSPRRETVTKVKPTVNKDGKKEKFTALGTNSPVRFVFTFTQMFQLLKGV